ncbi:hypothetical protein QJS66_02710 [Kocuria rhizophila]|nr:hypothetical protein QJS66_02710 [Kocuria rhizophila]
MHNGKRALTPMLLVMVAMGGRTSSSRWTRFPRSRARAEPYIVFTATAFSLMGLRQLYFLIDGLLDRLIYLSWGLSIILAFIGVKLILHALHENTLPFIDDGQRVAVVEIGIGLSLRGDHRGPRRRPGVPLQPEGRALHPHDPRPGPHRAVPGSSGGHPCGAAPRTDASSPSCRPTSQDLQKHKTSSSAPGPVPDHGRDRRGQHGSR